MRLSILLQPAPGPNLGAVRLADMKFTFFQQPWGYFLVRTSGHDNDGIERGLQSGACFVDGPTGPGSESGQSLRKDAEFA